MPGSHASRATIATDLRERADTCSELIDEVPSASFHAAPIRRRPTHQYIFVQEDERETRNSATDADYTLCGPAFRQGKHAEHDEQVLVWAR